MDGKLEKLFKKDYPVSFEKEGQMIINRIAELKDILSWLRAYPGDPDVTLETRKKIKKKIGHAREQLNVFEKHEGAPLTMAELQALMDWKDLFAPPILISVT